MSQNFIKERTFVCKREYLQGTVHSLWQELLTQMQQGKLIFLCGHYFSYYLAIS